VRRNYAFIAKKTAFKMAFPQDDYDCNELLDDWMCDWKVDIVFSVIASHWDVLYPRYSKTGEIRLAYTGYIDDSLCFRQPAQWHERPIDIGYRANKLPPYFGRVGETKWKIGELVANLSRQSNLVTDIVLGESGTLNGSSWLDFINECKFTLGSISGSSLLDPTGAIQRAIRQHMKENPRATFEEVEQLYFPGMEGRYEFTAISPRVLEAGMLGSCQILVEGEYSGLLKPWEHYIPIKADASDFDQVLQAMKDRSLTDRLVVNCRTLLMNTPALHYRTHAQEMIKLIEERVPTRVQASQPKLEEKRQEVLVLVAHAPQRDPRLAWIAENCPENLIIHQLGISRVQDDPETVDGSAETGWVWSYPRIEHQTDLAILRQLMSNQGPQTAIDEMASLIALASKKNEELRVIFDTNDSHRVEVFRWYFPYLLQIAASLIDRAQKLSGISAIVAADLNTLIAGIYLKELWGVPLFYDAHEFWPEADVSQAPFERTFWIALEGRLLKSVDRAMTVSPGLATYMSRLYGKPFMTVPNAEPLITVQAKQISAKNAKTCRFLFQGGFAPARGIDLLIKAWSATDADAILCLRGPESEDRQAMMKLAKSLGLFGTRIEFLDSVAETELVTAAVEYDVGLIPYTPTGVNYSNCCPNKLSQYMAAGLPILANKTSFVEQVIGEAGAGMVVDFTDTAQLVAAVNCLTADVGRRARYAQCAGTFYRERFHWQALSRLFYARLSRAASATQRQFAGAPHNGLNFDLSFSPVKSIVLADDYKPLYKLARRIWHCVPKQLRLKLAPWLRRFALQLRHG